MGARHAGREAALQMLFQLEASAATPDDVIQLFWRSFEADPEGRDYANQVVRGVAEHAGEIDARITKASENWRLERMSRVDRNVLRLATWELLQRGDVPRAVILDEAVELAKTYGTEDSKAFVNGVLSRVADEAGRTDPER
jgi:N utilization substance protein B